MNMPASKTATSALFNPWRLILVIMAAINLVAFWYLLQYGYSPKNYRAFLGGFGGTELIWIAVSVCAAVVVVVLYWRDASTTRRLVRAGLMATAVSLVILTKVLMVAHIQCLDAILFSATWGWAVFWLCASKSLDFDRTLSLRRGGRCWHPKMVNVFAAAIWIFLAGLFFYYMAQQIHRLNNLALGYGDCGENARMMYNTIYNPRELFLRINLDKSIFCGHVDFGVLPFVPLWVLWPDIKLTILLKVLAVLCCAFPIYWIGMEVLRDKGAALLLVATWLVFPYTSLFVYCSSYGFLWGDICLPLYFLALACWIKKRRGWSILFALWAIFIKEEAAVLIGSFGVYIAIFEGRRRQGAIVAFAAFAYFLLVTSVVIPAMNHHGYPQQSYFASLGASKWEIFLSPWTKPRIFWGKIFEPSTFYFVTLLLAPLLFVPLKKPSVLFVGSLIFLFDCLNPTLKSICYQYQTALLPVLFWALVVALREDDTPRQRAILSGAVISGVLLSLFFGDIFWSKVTVQAPLSPGRVQLVRRIAQPISQHDSLFATRRVAAQFITQKYLYVDPPLPTSIDCVMLDMHDSWQPQTDLHWLSNLRNLQRQVEAHPDLHLTAAEDGLLFYARQGAQIDARAMVERDALPERVLSQNLSLEYGLRIAAYSVFPQSGAVRDRTCAVRLTTFSTVDVRTNVDIAVRCVLRFASEGTETEEYVSEFQPLGQGIWPIERWEPGKFYADDFLVKIPADLTNRTFAVVFATATLHP